MNASNAKDKKKLVNPTLNINDNIHDIFTYKKAYQIHVRKLSEIRNLRKNNLKSATQRNFQIQHIKDVKHNNFMYKLNQEASKIYDDNLRLYDKLKNKQPTTKSRVNQAPLSVRIRRSLDVPIPFEKLERQREVERQNSRIRERLKSSESYINNSKLYESQKKRQQIKNRIRKFNQNSELKSERYYSAMSSRKEANAFSCNIGNTKKQTISDNNINNSGSKSSQKKEYGNDQKKNIASFYNAKDVIRNKIQNLSLKKHFEQRSQTAQNKKRKWSLKQDNVLFFPTEMG